MATLQKAARRRKVQDPAPTQLRFVWPEDRSGSGTSGSGRAVQAEKALPAVRMPVPLKAPAMPTQPSGMVERILPVTSRPAALPARIGSPKQIGALLEAVLGSYGITRAEIEAEIEAMAAESRAAT